MIIKTLTNGRIVIPKAIRQLLEIKDGDKLFLKFEDGKIILEKAKN